MYRTEVDGVHHELGTSGFLYRSNKLMYDMETRSLWSTLRGEPVVGPLVEKGIKLKSEYLVTTTWGEWKRRHQTTTVLSLDTGHDRDYGEGKAYEDYYKTDDLMFNVPLSDTRLKNKDQILALRFGTADEKPMALSTIFLSENPVYHGEYGGKQFVVLTDPSGGNRVFESGEVKFQSWDGDKTATDEDGKEWRLTEEALTGPDDTKLNRLPSHRAFWFGWHSAHPDTELIQ